jgi:chloramphenicol-sensitive protein RarD
MSLMGLLQYVSPTLQLLVGVVLFGEPFAGAKLAGFALIWLALALYTAEGLLFARTASRRARPA